MGALVSEWLSNLRITAAICTYNQAAALAPAVENLLAQSLRPTDFEILVLDNTSTNETPQIVQRYRAAVVGVVLRSTVQPHLGLSHALNLAVEMAGWLAALSDATLRPGGHRYGGRSGTRGWESNELR